MLKITAHPMSGGIVLSLEGKLSGPWVAELETAWRACLLTHPVDRLRVNLSSVSFIDDAGKALLARMHREGVRLIASGCMNRCIVEGIVQSSRYEAP